MFALEKDLQNAASAPHPGEEGPPYPGTCRDKGYTFDSDQTSVAWRFRPNPGPVNYEDTLWGPQTEDVASKVGDFVIKRKDGLWAYHLAVVVDDIRQGVTEVVREAEISYRAPDGKYNFTMPWVHRYRPIAMCHYGAMAKDNGCQKEKGDQAQTLGVLRSQGFDAGLIIGTLGRALGSQSLMKDCRWKI